MTELKVFETTLTKKNRVYIQPFTQTGNKKQDIKVNVPKMGQLLAEVFNNDTSEFIIFTNISEKTFNWLLANKETSSVQVSVPKVNHVDSIIFDIPHECLDKPLLFIDNAAELQPENLKDNMYLITFQIPYKLDWSPETFDYDPINIREDQISYHELAVAL